MSEPFRSAHRPDSRRLRRARSSRSWRAWLTRCPMSNGTISTSDYGEPVQAEAVADFDGVIALGSPYTAATVSGGGRMMCVARWGVGYDMVDTAALTANHVLLTIAVDAVRKPVAERS